MNFFVYLTQEKIKTLVNKDINLFTIFRLDTGLGHPWQVRGALGDATKDKSISFSSHSLGQLTRSSVDGFHSNLDSRLVPSVDQLVLAGVECKCLKQKIFETFFWWKYFNLHHISSSPQELAMKLKDCLWILNCSFRCPGASLDIASFLQFKYKAAISDDWTRCKAFKDSLMKRNCNRFAKYFSGSSSLLGKDL